MLTTLVAIILCWHAVVSDGTQLGPTSEEHRSKSHSIKSRFSRPPPPWRTSRARPPRPAPRPPPPPPPPRPPPPPLYDNTFGRSFHVEAWLIIGGIASVCLVGVILVAVTICCIVRKREKVPEPEESFPLDDSDPSGRAFTYKELCKTTRNFSDSNLLSSGGFGDVFKGTLPSGAPVAVKRFKAHVSNNAESFLAEATSLRHIRHRNLLRLRGWCSSAHEGMFLVFDLMRNGSLEGWTGNPRLSWSLRRRILAGVASGLQYLHEECVQCVLHRDIKASNVLLDEGFNAVLGDFGLARLVDHRKREKTTVVAGTWGYMAPEMMLTGKATKETDVYAFGVLVLEVVSGRAPVDQQQGVGLLDCAWRAHEAGSVAAVVDPGLHYEWDSMAVVGNALRLGLLCCVPDPGERPSMRAVHHWFQGSMLESPPLPASRPGSHGPLYLSSGGTTSSSEMYSSDGRWSA